MGSESDDYRAPDDGRPRRMDGWKFEAEREGADRRADADRDDAVREAIRSEQLTRDAEYARHRAETTDDPAVRARAQAWAHEAGHQADLADSNAWRGFRAADSEYQAASAAADGAVAEPLAAELQNDDWPDYDTPERRRDWADQLQSRGIDHDVVGSRIRADVGQALPATAIKHRSPAREPTDRSSFQAGRRPQRTRRAGRSR